MGFLEKRVSGIPAEEKPQANMRKNRGTVEVDRAEDEGEHFR
jgi:hypothetical protein